MLTSFFHDPHVVSDLLALCQTEGFVSPRVRCKVEIMVAHGLHPEQALIGTGLLSPEQYGEALSHLFDLPFVRKQDTPDRSIGVLDLETLSRVNAFVVDRDPTSALVAFCDPSSPEALRMVDGALEHLQMTLVPAVTLWSDVRKKQTRASASAGTLRRRLETTLSTSGIALVDGEKMHARSVTSSLMLQLRRKMPEGWNGKTVSTSHGHMIEWNPTSPYVPGAHPLEWSDAMRRFGQAKGGVQVVIRPDDSAKKMLTDRWPQAEPGTHRQAGDESPCLYHIEHEHEQEEALHAALMGRTICVIQSQEEMAWLRPLSEVGIPVTCFRRHLLPEGAAWTSSIVWIDKII